MANNAECGGAWSFFITHRRFAAVVIVAATALGLFSASFIPKESNPEVNVPVGVVTTVFPGASAEDVEELVTDVIEDRILSLDEVTKVTSTSRESLSIVSVEFDAKADTDERIDALKDKVDEAEVDFPEDVEDATVAQVSFDDQAVYTFSLAGPYPVVELTRFAERLQDDLERVSGVSRVEMSGSVDREVQVLVDKVALDRFSLSLPQVTNAIRLANADVPTGAIESGSFTYNVRLAGRLSTARDVAEVPVAAVGGVPVLVGDVAEVIDGFTESTSISRLSIDGAEPLPAVTLNIFKVSGGNILRLVESAEKVIANAHQEYLPVDVTSEVILDQAELISEDLGNLVTSGLQTIVIVMLLLFAFVGWRESLLAGLAIPLSFLITMVFLLQFGSTINFLTLFALILALGILIDSAIVVVEGMNANLRAGLLPVEAACRTVADFKLPLISGTLTTVFAFVPMLLMSGILGEFVKHIPITVTIVLLSSLFVALALVTAVGVVWLRPRREDDITEFSFGVGSVKPGKIFDGLSARYGRSLRSFLTSRGRKRAMTATLVVAFFASMSLPVIGVLSVNMFPPDDFDFFFVNFKKPPGTPLETTAAAMRPIEEALRQDPRIASFATNIGSLAQDDVGPSSTGSHLGSAVVRLKDERIEKSYDIIDEYGPLLIPVADGEVTVPQLAGGPPTGAPVLISFKGDDLEQLEAAALKVAAILEELPGTQNVQTSIDAPSGEFTIAIDRAKAEFYGVNTSSLAQLLRNAVSGTVATELREKGDEIEVLVKYALNREASRSTAKANAVDLASIESLTVATPQGTVPLGSFTRTELSGGRPSIRHEDGERVITATSDVVTGVAPQQIFQEVSVKLADLDVPPSVAIRMGGEAEDIEQSYQDMFRAMILAVFLIASVLVLQFNSFRQPLFILVTIPLALIGVFIGLLVLNLPVTFPGIIGIVALTGIVVNNAIILIDRINNLREEGSEILDAVVTAANSRLRPIFLTTVTTVFGMLPVTFTSELWRPLGFSIIFGLAFSTITTLYVVPMLYLRFARR